MQFWPKTGGSCCCAEEATPCTEIAAGNLVLTCPSGTHTLVKFVGTDVWSCCFSFTSPYTRDNVFAGCPSVASGLAYVEYRIGNCPPVGTSEDSTRGLVFLVRTGLTVCAASGIGYVYSRTSACSGNFLGSPTHDSQFWDEDYVYPPAAPTQFGQIPIDFTSGPFSMSFTLPAADNAGFPVPFPGDYVITQ